LIKNLHWNDHPLALEVLTEVGETGALLCQFLLAYRQGFEALSVFVAVFDWPEIAAGPKPGQCTSCKFRFFLF
jgi:hypothetical protein